MAKNKPELVTDLKDVVFSSGITLAEMAKQQDVIRKEASKLIADYIEAGSKIVKLIVEGGSEEDNLPESEELAATAYAYFNIANAASMASGVEYDIPYDYDYGDGDIMSSALEESGDGDFGKNMEKLFDLLCDMEYKSRKWNASTC
jgi:hypothetical protein